MHHAGFDFIADVGIKVHRAPRRMNGYRIARMYASDQSVSRVYLSPRLGVVPQQVGNMAVFKSRRGFAHLAKQ